MKTKEQNAKETVSTLVYAYLVILFAGLPLYMQDKLVMIGNAKYLFFRNTTLVLGIFVVLAVLWQRIAEGNNKTKRPRKKTDLFMLLYLASAAISYGISPCKADTFLGYPGWYMGLLTQVLLVGIYFAVSRYYDGSRSIWWIAGIAAGIVTLIGLLNRLGIDVLGTFRGMENGEWNRTQLLSTIGNNNWYSGYISVTVGITLAAAFMGKKYVRTLGMIGSFLYFASAVTSNSTTAVVAACSLNVVLLLLSLRQRRQLLRALEILMLLPLAVFMVRFPVQFQLTGLALAGSVERMIFFSPVWYVLFALEAAGYVILRLREKQQKRDLLQNGSIFRTVFIVVAVTVLLGTIAVCLILMGVLGKNSEFLSQAFNGRFSLWMITLRTYTKEGLLFKIFGTGPGSYYYVLYQWIGDIIDWINGGFLENNTYSNAHNEWLNMLIEQGISGVVAYGGIFVTALAGLKKRLGQSPECLAVFLGIIGYLICSMFTFQHVLSTPFAFALLGMAEGVFYCEKHSLKQILKVFPVFY